MIASFASGMQRTTLAETVSLVGVSAMCILSSHFTSHFRQLLYLAIQDKLMWCNWTVTFKILKNCSISHKVEWVAVAV